MFIASDQNSLIMLFRIEADHLSATAESKYTSLRILTLNRTSYTEKLNQGFPSVIKVRDMLIGTSVNGFVNV